MTIDIFYAPTILMEQLLDGYLWGVEHQSGHVIEICVLSNRGTEVVSCLILERRITLWGQESDICEGICAVFGNQILFTNPGQSNESVRVLLRTHDPRNVAAIKTLAVVTMTIRTASTTLQA